MADVDFMFNDPIGGSCGTPVVGEGKVGLEGEIGRKGVVFLLDGHGKCVVCYNKWCSYQNSLWGKLGEMSLLS